MQISNAQYIAGVLQLDVPVSDGYRFMKSFKAGEYDVKRKTAKRSLNANSFAWCLMSKISEKTGIPVEEVYQNAISEVSGKTTALTISSIAADDFIKAFCAGHIGRMVHKLGEHFGNTDLLLTYGSSDYDRQQMNTFLNAIIEDCRALDIETNLDMERLLNEWEKKRCE